MIDNCCEIGRRGEECFCEINHLRRKIIRRKRFEFTSTPEENKKTLWEWVERVKMVNKPEHKCKEFWELTEIFCPYCGEQTVDVQIGDGDYYQGPMYECWSCDGDFHL